MPVFCSALVTDIASCGLQSLIGLLCADTSEGASAAEAARLVEAGDRNLGSLPDRPYAPITLLTPCRRPLPFNIRDQTLTLTLVVLSEVSDSS